MDEDLDIRGRPLAQDPNLEPGAFLRRPPGERVYYGFPGLDDAELDGFTFGKITDFEAQQDDDGDAFVVAPDGERAGLVWEVTGEASVCSKPIVELEANRWGVWSVTFPHLMRTHEDAQQNLAAILPELRAQWQEWRRRYS